MDQTGTRQVVEEYFARLNAHDTAGIRRFMPWTDEEWAPWERSLTAMLRAFPDFRIDVEHLIVEGDKAAALVRVTGTHTDEFPAGELEGIAATGRRISWSEAHFSVVRDGQFVAGGLVVDSLDRLRQLGAATTPQGDFPPEQ